MTGIDYEAATLAARHAGLWLVGAQLFVGLLQTGIVAWGIRAMVRANDERAAAAAAVQREADRRHAEVMQASAEARREADRRHAENMAALKAQTAGIEAIAATLAANTATLAEATAALKVVVERTAPQGSR